MAETNWQPPRGGHRREQPEPAKPRDYVAEAKATIALADHKSEIIAAVVVAQALDRIGKQLVEAAAINNYKRTP